MLSSRSVGILLDCENVCFYIEKRRFEIRDDRSFLRMGIDGPVTSLVFLISSWHVRIFVIMCFLLHIVPPPYFVCVFFMFY